MNGDPAHHLLSVLVEMELTAGAVSAESGEV
jgi:hypothetical protein